MNKLTKEQVCGVLGISPRKLDYMIDAREFPRGVKNGKTLLWAESVVKRFDEERFADQLAWFDTRLAQ